MKDPQNDNKNGSGVSRRDFLRGSGATAAASALGTVALPTVNEATPPAQDVPQRGPGAVQVQFTVDGEQLTTNVEPRVTLLDALRNYLDAAGNHLDVTGCKRVCDRGTCGACTIMLNNRPIYACSMLAVEAEGAQIRTAESLVNNNEMDAVPAAFVQYDAQQCGFCTPGFVVAMRAALDANPNASPEEVEEGLSGNICRCGTYEQMRDTVYHLCNRQREV